MKAFLLKNIRYLAPLLLGCPAMAQTSGNYFAPERHDVGAIVGSAFYMGDLKDNTTLLRDLSFYTGLLYRYHFNNYYSMRGQAAAGYIKGHMRRSDMPSKNGNEKWEFNRALIFFEVVSEIGFLPVSPVVLDNKKRWAPYLLGGFGFTVLSPDIDKYGKDADKRTTAGYLLLGAGVKFVLASRITIGAECMARKTVNDQLDFADSPPGSWAINRDWLWTAGISLTYRLYENRLCSAHRRHSPRTYKLKGISEN